jgi:hypothetical protein
MKLFLIPIALMLFFFCLPPMPRTTYYIITLENAAGYRQEMTVTKKYFDAVKIDWPIGYRPVKWEVVER